MKRNGQLTNLIMGYWAFHCPAICLNRTQVCSNRVIKPDRERGLWSENGQAWFSRYRTSNPSVSPWAERALCICRDSCPGSKGSYIFFFLGSCFQHGCTVISVAWQGKSGQRNHGTPGSASTCPLFHSWCFSHCLPAFLLKSASAPVYHVWFCFQYLLRCCFSWLCFSHHGAAPTAFSFLFLPGIGVFFPFQAGQMLATLM